MLAERLHSPEQLIRGKSIVEVISLLPVFSWYIECRGRRIKSSISSLTIVDYDTWKPRIRPDLFGNVSVTPGTPIEIERLSCELMFKPGRTIGLTSLVGLGGSYTGVDFPWAHLPLIDFDLDLKSSNLAQMEQLQLIRREIEEKTEINQGIILASGLPGHFHFIGRERLFTMDQLPTFLGACLNMRDHRNRQMVDPEWVGHSLTAMKDKGGSIYDYAITFATLRTTTSDIKPHLPIVVDVF